MATRTLITGATGFVGTHLAQYCLDQGDEVHGLSRTANAETAQNIVCDLLDLDAAKRSVANAQPEVVHHLAALASTGRSWQDPARCINDNQAMTWNLLEAVRAEAPEAIVLLAGSGESYGRPQDLPIREDHRLAPTSPYAIAKTACDLIGGLFAEAHGLKVIRARAFNHAGPNQAGEFLIGSLVAQVATAAASGEDSVTLLTGSGDIRRDYTDVRDVVRAYRDLALSNTTGVVNVCRGASTSTSEIVALVAQAAGDRVNVEHSVDDALIRPHETPEVVGSPDLINRLIGWQAQIPLEQTVADALEAALAASA